MAQPISELCAIQLAIEHECLQDFRPCGPLTRIDSALDEGVKSLVQSELQAQADLPVAAGAEQLCGIH
ncbi:hypothetical protein N8D74_18035 (plasmid) [Curtobacterium flaccumfaciens]|uniref:Uncharacterized protein n=1 Tax=Curtobacterium poinsettiae TaxID=159612 RepID=A0A9Q9T566_9MICO|nr:MULTISPECIES: hypothetical protein [Curtobacterium]UXN27179.1 hypothetical protein N8D74_18035 [Curtobacterium flaccumfaciens]UYC82687.1 hypothetical protein OE229_17800 [Curtobacterium flaccumfaciens pv. poinsettiae]WIE64906.1 hypothetical protein DEI99_016985 [Curtobacterium sp. MCLR17_036]